MDDVVLNYQTAMDAIPINVQAEEEISIPVGSTYQTGAGVVPRYQTLSQMQMNVLSWASNRSPEYTTFAQNMVDAGFLPESAMDQPTSAANNLQYPVQVFQAYRAGGGDMDFNEWFDWYSSTARAQRSSSGIGGGSGGGGYSGPRTRTSVTITSPEDAEVLLQEAARDMIGRSLTAEEIEKYTKQYRKRERKAVSTTTTTPTSTVTEQGTSKETILRSLMENNPDFARYQIDTGFMDMFVDSIREGQAVINAGR